MQLTMVSAVPLCSGIALWATNVEKSGESAITTKPQIIKKMSRTKGTLTLKMSGEIRQQMQESDSAVEATFFVPKF